MVSHHDGIPVTGYAFYSHDTLRRMARANQDLEAHIARSIAHIAGIGSIEPGLLPERIDLERPASWLCPPMGATQVVVLSNAGGGGTRIVLLPSCVDDVRVEVLGKLVPVQADRLLSSDGGFLLRIGPLELEAFSLLSLEVSVAIATTNTDAFPSLPTGSSARSVERASGRNGTSSSIENSRLRVEFSTQGITRVVDKLSGEVLAFAPTFWLYSGKGSNTYSFAPSTTGAQLELSDYEWLSMSGALHSFVRLSPKNVQIGAGDATDLDERDVSIGAVVVELSEEPSRAHLLQVSYEGLHLERGTHEYGYNLMVRHNTGSSNAACRWTYWENAYEPIDVLPVPAAEGPSSYRPMASAMELACGKGQRGFGAVGSHGRGHVVTDEYIEFMLHRRLPSTPSPDLYHQWTKGDDSSTVSTTLHIDLGVTNSVDDGLQGLFRELELAPLYHQLPSVWEWGMPQVKESFVTGRGFSNCTQSFVSEDWPRSVSILHLSRSEEVTAGCAATFLLSLYRPATTDSLDKQTVSIDLQTAFPKFNISQVSERIITMGDGVKDAGCLQTAGSKAVIMMRNSVCALSICLQ